MKPEDVKMSDLAAVGIKAYSNGCLATKRGADVPSFCMKSEIALIFESIVWMPVVVKNHVTLPLALVLGSETADSGKS